MNPPDLKTQFLQELGRFRPLAGADLAWSAEPGSLEWPAGHPAPDYVVDARLPSGEPWKLLVEQSSTGFPRDVAMAASRLKNHLEAARGWYTGAVDGVILADALSPDSRTRLQEAGLGYFDGGGSIFLWHEPGLWVQVDRPPPKRARARMRSMFAPAREQVVLALLLQKPDVWVSNEEIEAKSGATPSTVSETLKALQQHGWLSSDVDGKRRMRRLAEPGKVLDAWAEARKARRDLATSYYVWAPDQQALLKRVGHALQGVGFNWALTGPAAMNQIESHLTGVNDVTLSIPVGRREQVASLLGLGEAPEGSNVTLIERPGQADFQHGEVPSDVSLQLPSRFVLYSDLLAGKGRDKDAAAHLRKTRIGF